MRVADDSTFGFPKTCRLKSSLRIKNLVQQRQNVFTFPIKCFYSVVVGDGLKLAVSVSKKRFPHATDRNRVKRLMREAFRLCRCKLVLPEGCSVVMCWMYVDKVLPSFTQLRTAAEHVFDELQSVVLKKTEK